MRDGFHALFVEAMGTKPSWGAKEIKQIKTLLRKASPDVVLDRARAMFAMRGRFPAEHPCLATLVSHFDRFAAKPARDVAYGWAAPAPAEAFEKASADETAPLADDEEVPF